MNSLTNILLVMILMTQIFLAAAVWLYGPHITQISAEVYGSRIWLERIGEKGVRQVKR
jgi:hypothetical protein